MRAYDRSQLSDHELTCRLASSASHERSITASLLADIAEFDARRLYLPAAYPSTYAYCLHELHMSEDATSKRIQAARVARRFPVIFEALAGGRLHLSGVCLLAPHLTPENADELLAAATHRTKAQLAELIAQRFPRSEMLPLVVALPAVVGAKEEHAPGHVEPRSRVGPVAPGRSLLQVTIARRMEEKLRYAQELLGHELPSGDLAQVLERALDALIEKLERRKFAATSRARRTVRPSRNPRHIPAHVKRVVWERDQGRCTYVSESGRRCAERKMLEFDHVEPVARGGEATVEGIRLRCRAHNQYGAECTFGAEFMRAKREQARAAAAEARSAVEAERQAAATRARASADELITPLRLLGFSADQSRRAAALCQAIPGASLEQRMRGALSYLRPRARTVAPTAASLGSAP